MNPFETRPVILTASNQQKQYFESGTAAARFLGVRTSALFTAIYRKYRIKHRITKQFYHVQYNEIKP